MTVTENVGNVVALAPTGTKPESIPRGVVPFTSGAQGDWKDDWVRVWFLAWNSKTTLSPIAASTKFGT